MAGILGLVGSEGNFAAAGILAAAALILLTFWRNVWISWTAPSVPTDQAPTDQAPAEGGGTWQAVFGFVVLLVLLAVVRGCGKEIIRAIL